MPMNEQDADKLVHAADPAQVEEGLAWLRGWAEANPDEARRWYVYGGALDFSDRPEEAIVAYGRAFDIGVETLPAEDQPRIHVQAGSTLRNLGRLTEARTLLQEGCRRYPAVQALPVFLALVEVSAGEDRRAIDLLFTALLTERPDDSVERYRRALTWYAEDIRQP